MDVNKEFEFSYILGSLAGDGFTGKNTERQRMIMLSVKSKEFAETFRDCLLNFCNHKHKVSKVKNYRYSQGYCWVVRCLRPNIVSLFENFNVHDLFNKSTEYKSGFLRGFFDAEGCCFYKYYPKRQSNCRIVIIVNKDKKLLELCKNLLNSLGIRTRKISKRPDVYALDLSISKENLIKFRTQVGFSIPYKISNLESCLRSYRGG